MSEILTPDKKRERIEQQPQDIADQVRALPYVKEVRLPDRARLESVKTRISRLAQTRPADVKFQQNVVGYLNEMVNFLERPTIIDTFGDRPEDHAARRIEIRKLGIDSPLYKYLETQKLSGGNVLGGVLTIFAQRYMPMLYRPSKNAEVLERIADEAESVRIEMLDKFDATVTTPLEEKLEVIKRVEDFVENSIDTYIEAYTGTSQGAREYRRVDELRPGDKVLIDDRILQVTKVDREQAEDGTQIQVYFNDNSVRSYPRTAESVEIQSE